MSIEKENEETLRREEMIKAWDEEYKNMKFPLQKSIPPMPSIKALRKERMEKTEE